jgi:hypothetical protein
MHEPNTMAATAVIDAKIAELQEQYAASLREHLLAAVSSTAAEPAMSALIGRLIEPFTQAMCVALTPVFTEISAGLIAQMNLQAALTTIKKQDATIAFLKATSPSGRAN